MKRLINKTTRPTLVTTYKYWVWLGLLVLFHDGRKTRATFDEALADLAEPIDANRMPLVQIALPFLFRRRGVRVTRNIVYREVTGKMLKLDVAMPIEPGKNRPAIMQIHGGGWIIGDKREQGWPLIGHLAANGWVCFNLGFDDSIWFGTTRN